MSDQLPPRFSSSEADEFTLRDLASTVQGLLRKWPLILACTTIGVAISFVVNHYAVDQYKIKATIAVEEAENPLASAEGMLDFAFGLGGRGIVETRIAILKSYAHNLRVSKNLGWGVKYYKKGRLNKREVYDPDHFSVDFDPSHPQLLGAEFTIDFRRDRIFLTVGKVASVLKLYDFDLGEELTAPGQLPLPQHQEEFKYGEWIESEGYRFRIQRGEGLNDFLSSQNISTSSFEFVSLDNIANWAMLSLSAESSDKKNSSLLMYGMYGPHKGKMVDYLNASINALREYELEQKNEMAINTIAFIDEQIGQIEGSLRDSESALEEFRSDNLIVDLSSEGSQIVEHFIELEQERAALTLQRSFYFYVIDFLANKESFSGLSLPPMRAFDDPLVLQLIDQLVETSVMLERMSFSLEKDNPALQELEKELRYAKQALYNVTENALSSSELVLRTLTSESILLKKKSASCLRQNKNCWRQRQYEIRGGQYQLLLEKRAEAGILRLQICPTPKS